VATLQRLTERYCVVAQTLRNPVALEVECGRCGPGPGDESSHDGESRRALPKGDTMELGAFSISLAVKDLDASRAFYQRLGFVVFAGDAAQHWLIMKNGHAVIGLFQGMFEQNILTFNPGWDQDARELDSFTDVRELQRRLKAQGVAFAQEADESTAGPGSFVVVDPDGNPILVDQHVGS
jgi:lactoylglutathione lyase